MAGVEGLEPSQTVLETGVLPLTPYPYVFTCIMDDNFKCASKVFMRLGTRKPPKINIAYLVERQGLEPRTDRL